MKLFTVRLHPRLIDRLKMRAVREHTTVQALVAQAVESLLKSGLRSETQEGDK